MTRTYPHWCTAAVMVASLWGSEAAFADVRTENARLAALIHDAVGRSDTFRTLAAAIDMANGIVYVATGRCGRLRACLLHQVSMAGPRRVLTIVVDPQRDDVGLMAAIAHELQHALEVLSDVRITTDAAIVAYYRARGVGMRGVTETRAAIQAGDTVRRELRR